MKVKLIKQYSSEFLEQEIQKFCDSVGYCNIKDIQYSSFYNSHTGHEIYTALVIFEEE